MSYNTAQQRNQKLNKLYNETKHSYGAGAYFDERKQCLKKYSCSSKYYKKQAVKAVRRKLKNNNIQLIGGDYKKYYDYKWMVL